MSLDNRILLILKMKCPQCGAKNEGSKKFCGECGAQHKEGLICPACNILNPTDKKHCSECGQKLVITKKDLNTEKAKKKLLAGDQMNTKYVTYSTIGCFVSGGLVLVILLMHVMGLNYLMNTSGQIYTFGTQSQIQEYEDMSNWLRISVFVSLVYTAMLISSGFIVLFAPGLCKYITRVVVFVGVAILFISPIADLLITLVLLASIIITGYFLYKASYPD